MPSLAQLEQDALRVAIESADTLLSLRAYGPEETLPMLLGKWRDDLCEELGRDPWEPRHEGPHRSLRDLDVTEVGSAYGALVILLQPRFLRVMDDPDLPDLLAGYQSVVNAIRAEHLKPHKKVGALWPPCSSPAVS